LPSIDIYRSWVLSRYLCNALQPHCHECQVVEAAQQKDTEAVMHGTHYWVVGGEFRSLNFHQLVHGTAQVEGPFPTRKEAENAWRTLSEKNRHRCNVRFSIVEEPRKAMV
jgi:hypothetical protein